MRIEFWDDEIDSIRSMDAQSQRSVEKLEEASIFPLREMVYTEEQAVSAAERIEQEYRKVLKNLEQKGETENAERLREHIGEDAIIFMKIPSSCFPICRRTPCLCLMSLSVSASTWIF